MTATLDAAGYWKLRAICAEAQRCEVLALQARADLARAHKQQEATLVALGLDPKMPTFSLDDDTLTITVPDAVGGTETPY
jgi:hypothetical protein